MTPEMKTTIEYMQESARLAGFSSDYNEPISKGVQSGKGEIPLPYADKKYPDGTHMLWQPKLVELERYAGKYNLSYTATLAQPDKPLVQQTFNSYKKTGATLDQSALLLKGNTVLITDWDNETSKRRTIFAKLDLSVSPKPGENHPVQRVNAAQLDLGILYSKGQVVAKPHEKERHLTDLQKGKRIDVTVRDMSGDQTLFVPAQLQLNLVNEPSGLKLAMNIYDADGVLLRSPSIAPNKAETQTQGLVVGNQDMSKLPEDLLKILKPKDASPEQTLDKNNNKKNTPKPV